MRKRLYDNFLAAAAAVAILLPSACSEDPAANNALSGPKLRFEVIDTHGWQTPSQSRTAGDKTDEAKDAPEYAGVFTLQGETLADTLFLHATVTDGIESNRSDAGVPQTRATPVEEDTFYESFGVLASAYTGSWSETSCLMDYMYNVEITKSSGWTTNYFWPGGGRKVRFFAYAPYGGQGIVLSDKTQAGAPTITYTVPDEVADQQDLLVASPDETEGNTSAVVVLPFKHALTAVKFSCGDDISAGIVKSIKFKGVYSAGTFDFDTSAWSGQKTPADFGQNPNKEADSTPDSAITEGEATFMMLPQTLPDGAQIEVVFNDGAADHTLTANIGGTKWVQGTTITYRLSTTSINWDYTFEVTPPAAVSYQGGNTEYTVKSYRMHSSGTTQAVAWSAEFSTDGGQTWTMTCPAWVSAFTASGAGSTTGQSCTATVIEQDATTSGIDHTQVLQDAPPKGTQANPYDLSMYDIDGNPQSGMTTANCYVVRAPGWYRIPLVYGNAVKNGATNRDAYDPGRGGSITNGIGTFFRHDDNNITAPCIADNGFSAASAEMVWNDANDEFVSNVRIENFNATIDGADKSLQYLVFEIPQASIMQGNAVLAAKTDAAMLWSWHIWVTDEELTPIGVTNYMDEVNYMMPVNLGWCSGSSITTAYAERSCRVKITQTASGNSRIFTLIQTAYSSTSSTSGNNPYYQWGRKDPFLPGDGPVILYDKACFGTKWSYSSSSVTIGVNIQNPTVFYCSSVTFGSCNTTYSNMWNAKNTKNNVAAYNVPDVPVVKTVYDPCPPGFHVSPTNAFTGFTTTGQDSNISSEWNVNGSFDKGWNFYSGKNKTGPTIFFPATCFRSYDSGVVDRGGGGFCWSVSPVGSQSGYHLAFLASSVRPQQYKFRGLGISVRPVRE